MFSLTEIVYSGNPKYLQYFSRKTEFLVVDFQMASHCNVRWLWRHLGKKFDFAKQYSSLNNAEKNKFKELLLNFGYLSSLDAVGEKLEKKIPWIFLHPSSGIFIPLEVLKLLMQEELCFKENFLFSLIYKLKIKEQKYFASLIGGSLEGQVALSFESNPLDMALVLYIWLADHMENIDDVRHIIPERGKILKSPYAFSREERLPPLKNVKSLSTLLPKTPVPIWDYLPKHFSHLDDDLEKLHTLITRGNKGFYRSVALLKNQNSDLIKAIKNGILLPVITQSVSKKKNKTNIMLVTPVEFHYILKRNFSGKSTTGKIQI